MTEYSRCALKGVSLSLSPLTMMNRFLILLLLCSGMSHAFVTPPCTSFVRKQSPMIMMAGFGAAKELSKKEPRLKPKAQWDRYSDLKKELTIRVAVRVMKEGEEWLEVGRVRSKDNQYTEIAIVKQRAIIADHARRLFPLQVSQKDKIEWAYWQGGDDDGSWAVVEGNVVIPDGIEKHIGFEGKPDPATGFYCMYDAGRLLEKQDKDKPPR